MSISQINETRPQLTTMTSWEAAAKIHVCIASTTTLSVMWK